MGKSVFLGCSRGFGAQVSRRFSTVTTDGSAILVGRKRPQLEEQAALWKGRARVQCVDFSKRTDTETFFDGLVEQDLKRVVYFAGGGPFGTFADKAWKDHLWAYQVNFLSPSYLLHRALLANRKGASLKQIVFVGSAVADSQPDPMAASYAASKHGMRGLVESILAEGTRGLDLRFFRPGYMDTDMLPPNARPRVEATAIGDPKVMAEQFVKWAEDPLGAPVYTP